VAKQPDFELFEDYFGGFAPAYSMRMKYSPVLAVVNRGL